MSRVRENMMARLREAASQPAASTGEVGGKIDRKEEPIGDSTDGGQKNEEEKEDTRGVARGGSGGGGSPGGVGVGGSTQGNGSGVPGVSGGEGGGAGSAEYEWVEETVEHPVPDYGIDSPVIR